MSILSLLCQVDLSCMVSTIRWYHEMANGTEVLIKVNAQSYITFHSQVRFLESGLSLKVTEIFYWIFNSTKSGLSLCTCNTY